jgi:hypothetical protein
MWAKLDDKLPRHPKILRAAKRLAGKAGDGTTLSARREAKLGRVRVFAAHAQILCYCGEFLTNGFFPDEAVEELHDPEPMKVIAVLQAEGLLEPRTGGYQVHDYEDENPDAEAEKERRKRDRVRKQQARARKQGGEQMPLALTTVRLVAAVPVRADNADVSADMSTDTTRTRAADMSADNERMRPADQSGHVHAASAGRLARARDPVPSRPVPSDLGRKPRAAARPALADAWTTTAAIRQHLRAAAHDRLDRDPDVDDGELAEDLKRVAAACRAGDYTSRRVSAVIDAVRGERARRRRA